VREERCVTRAGTLHCSTKLSLNWDRRRQDGGSRSGKLFSLLHASRLFSLQDTCLASFQFSAHLRLYRKQCSARGMLDTTGAWARVRFGVQPQGLVQRPSKDQAQGLWAMSLREHGHAWGGPGGWGLARGFGPGTSDPTACCACGEAEAVRDMCPGHSGAAPTASSSGSHATLGKPCLIAR
jgi:hypothetical protein